jgi:hypothetical protein
MSFRFDSKFEIYSKFKIGNSKFLTNIIAENLHNWYNIVTKQNFIKIKICWIFS